MNFAAALEEIKKGHIRPLYLLHGEEIHLGRRLEQAIVEAVLAPEDRDMNMTVFDHDPDCAALINQIETVPFFGGKSVTIVRNTSLFRSSRKQEGAAEATKAQGDDRLVKALARIPEYSVLIFVATEADKRRKLYKEVEKYGVTVELMPLKLKDARGWIEAKLNKLQKKMAVDAMEYFLNMLSVVPQISLDFLDNELDKIVLYCSTGTVIRKEQLLQVLSTTPEVSVFAMIDALSQRQTAKALNLLGEQLTSGEPPLRILALLARQVRMLWQAKELAAQGLGSRPIADALGLPGFIGEKLMNQSQRFSEEKLRAATMLLAEADYALKSGRATGIVLEQIIIEMCM